MDGDYRPHPDRPGEKSRRSAACVTRWCYLVVESDRDDITRQQWLKFLVQLRLDIVAIYDTGGRLPHALVQLPPCRTKEDWDAKCDRLLPLLVMFGADKKTMTAVRLSRLPQCQRLGKIDKDGNYQKFDSPRLQGLLYFCPPNGYLPDYLPKEKDRYLPIIERPTYG